MIGRTDEIVEEYFDHVRAESVGPRYQPYYESWETASERGANWPAVAVVGAILLFFGFMVSSIDAEVGFGVIIFGLLVLAGARFAKKMEEDTAQQWMEEMSADEIGYDPLDRSEERQREIEEIIKAVKTTIRVRCRYCGTLNEEKADECESCGASL
jgi:hypothetical protein